MNSVDMATNLIFRAKNLNAFTVTTDVPENFRFNGLVPFDMSIKEGQIEAKVWAVDFDEAVNRLNQYLETCKDD
jgi:hypothetical protein